MANSRLVALLLVMAWVVGGTVAGFVTWEIGVAFACWVSAVLTMIAFAQYESR